MKISRITSRRSSGKDYKSLNPSGKCNDDQDIATTVNNAKKLYNHIQDIQRENI